MIASVGPEITQCLTKQFSSAARVWYEVCSWKLWSDRHGECTSLQGKSHVQLRGGQSTLQMRRYVHLSVELIGKVCFRRR